MFSCNRISAVGSTWQYPNPAFSFSREETHMAERSRLVESHDQAVHRLAALAEERGITIHWHDREGFIRHQRCSHFARLLAELDELPPLDPAPTPDEMAERRGQRV